MIATSIFLLPNGTFVVELLVVAVILFLMTKYILPPLNRAMEGRQEKIRSIVAGAQETSDRLKAEAGGRAQVEYDRIVATAQSEVVAARQHAVDEASARIGEIVFDLVSKIVGREVDQSTHDDLVREAVAALHAEATKGSNH